MGRPAQGSSVGLHVTAKHKGERMRSHTRALAILASVTFAAGCSEPETTPTGDRSRPAAGSTASDHRTHDAGATASWTELAISLTERAPANVATHVRLPGDGPVPGSKGGGRRHRDQNHRRGVSSATIPSVSISAAIGGASASRADVVLPRIRRRDRRRSCAAQRPPCHRGRTTRLRGSGSHGCGRRRRGAGVCGGRPGTALADPGTPPIGDGYWKWSGGPIARGGYHARPFFIASGEDFPPAPPPAFGSPAYLTALGEVRQISDTRTAEQLAIAQFWNVQQSPTREPRGTTRRWS